MPAASAVGAAAVPFLGIERSLGGRCWQARSEDERLALALAQRLGLPEILGRVLAARGAGIETAESFLAPKLRDHLPDPSRLLDMDKAASRLAAAIRAGEKVAVFGDYDVDGATSSALLLRFFAAVGGDLRLYVPDRLKEGYGPNAPALLALKAQGVSLVVTVDCGIVAHVPLEAAAESGLEVIVIDHHLAEPDLPRALALVNPNRLDETPGLGQLAAVGVAFLLVVALNRSLRAAGWYRARPEPDLKQWLDLVALGTVCDVVPLTGVNRALVYQGLKIMARRGNAGLAALADVAGIGEPPGAYHLGFLLGPRVNAGGRVGEADLGARLLSTPDAAEAAALAKRLDLFNAERREIEAQVLEQAKAEAAACDPLSPILVVSGEGWHPGVIGIVASRLKDQFGRPALVIAREGRDQGSIGRGSARSVRGVDLGAAVTAARQAGLLINGGGHAMAAGLTVAVERIGELAGFLAARLGRDSAPAPSRLGIDGALAVRGANAELLELLEQAGPYGAGHAEPRFVLTGARVGEASVVGENHVRCQIHGADGARLKAIAFRARESALGEALLRRDGAPLLLAGQIRADFWRGEKRVQFTIEDGAYPAGRT